MCHTIANLDLDCGVTFCDILDTSDDLRHAGDRQSSSPIEEIQQCAISLLHTAGVAGSFGSGVFPWIVELRRKARQGKERAIIALGGTSPYAYV